MATKTPVAAGNTHCHGDGFGSAGRTVVHGGVGDLHACELADHGLELEDGLQGSLGNLRLVRRVRGEELTALDERIDNHRPVVAVGAGAEKAGVAGSAVGRSVAEVFDDFRLGHLAGYFQVAGQPIFLRNGGKEIVDGTRTDLLQHLDPFARRFWQIAHVQVL